MISYYHFISEFYNKVVSGFFDDDLLIENEHFKNDSETAFLLTSIITSAFNYAVLEDTNIVGTNDLNISFDQKENTKSHQKIYIDNFGFFSRRYNLGGWYFNLVQSIVSKVGDGNNPTPNIYAPKYDPYRDKNTGEFWGIDDIHRFIEITYQENPPFNDIERIAQCVLLKFTSGKYDSTNGELFNETVYVSKHFKKEKINAIPKLSITTWELLISEFFALLNDLIWSGQTVCIENLGTFKLSATPSRVGRNPKTGEKVLIPEKVKILKSKYDPFYQEDQIYKPQVLKAIQNKKSNSGSFKGTVLRIYFDDATYHLSERFGTNPLNIGFKTFCFDFFGTPFFDFEINVSLSFAIDFLKELGYKGNGTLKPYQTQQAPIGGDLGFF